MSLGELFQSFHLFNDQMVQYKKRLILHPTDVDVLKEMYTCRAQGFQQMFSKLECIYQYINSRTNSSNK